MPETLDSSGIVDLSVVLPAFNEQDAVEVVIRDIRDALRDWHGVWEILVVDDASWDCTAERAESTGVVVIRRAENGGAGAARKTGIRNARGGLVAMIDVDGSYPVCDLPKMLEYFPQYDQVNGMRTSEQGSNRVLRVPVKWLIRKTAEYLSAKSIPDLNTGMKVFKRDIMLQYMWAIPDGFSCVTSMTLAFICNGHPVKYVPIAYRPRIGTSKFRPVRDTATYAMTVVRVIMYFQPLRVFLPLALAVGAIAVTKIVIDMATSPAGILDSDILLSFTAMLLLAVGLVSDLIVAQRRGG